MKNKNCKNVCDQNGMVMTLINETHESRIVPSGNDGFIRIEKTYKTFKKIQCDQCLQLNKSESIKLQDLKQ